MKNKPKKLSTLGELYRSLSNEELVKMLCGLTVVIKVIERNFSDEKKEINKSNLNGQ